MTNSPMKKSVESKSADAPLYFSPVKVSEAKTPMRLKQSEAKTPLKTSPVKPSEAKIALSFTPGKETSSAEKTALPRSLPFGSPVKRAGKSVQQLYRVIQKTTGAVGGYGHNGPVYGEITMGTFQKVIDAMTLHTGFDASSSFIDIGSGLGKPNLHVALNPGVKLSYGIELEQLRWQLSMHNLRFVMKEVPEMRKSVVYFANRDATEMDTFEPFTHVYSFDVGFPPAVLISLANAFNRSKCVKCLVSFQRPDRVISLYGFAVELVDQITTRMNGSSETHTAYIYRPTGGGKSKPRHQLQTQLQSFLVNKDDGAKKTDKDDGTKKTASEKAKSSSLADLFVEDYVSWVVNTGVIGAPGERPQRSLAARTRANK